MSLPSYWLMKQKRVLWRQVLKVPVFDEFFFLFKIGMTARNLWLNSRDIITQRSNANHSKLTLSLFHTRVNTVLYYRLKSAALLLNSLLFNWKLHHSPLCRVCFSADETIQHISFNYQAQNEETIALKRFCSLAKTYIWLFKYFYSYLGF